MWQPRTKRWMKDREYGARMLYFPNKLAAQCLPSGVPLGEMVRFNLKVFKRFKHVRSI